MMRTYKLKTGRLGDAVVSAYQAVENTVVSSYQKVEDAFVDAFLERTDDEKDGGQDSGKPDHPEGA